MLKNQVYGSVSVKFPKKGGKERKADKSSELIYVDIVNFTKTAPGFQYEFVTV